MSITSEWNAKQKRLNACLGGDRLFPEARALALELHASVHFAAMSGQAGPTLLDRLWEGLSPGDFAKMPKAEDVTIAWDIWHITRIEDLTASILLGGQAPVLDEEWLSRLGVTVRDTGNAMTDEEIMAFSKRVDIGALGQYRIAVGRQTAGIIAGLEPGDLKRKAGGAGLEAIRREGGVVDHPDSRWLLEFWGKKDMAGLIRMPLTRHQIVHINDAFQLKRAIERGKPCYLS